MKTTYLENEIILLEGYKKDGTISHYQNRKLAEYKNIKQLLISGVINWVSTKDELPPLHKYVLLYKIDNDEHRVEFIHEFDLTTNRYTQNWTHWAIIKPPCL
jgi:hypothetical protein